MSNHMSSPRQIRYGELIRSLISDCLLKEDFYVLPITESEFSDNINENDINYPKIDIIFKKYNSKELSNLIDKYLVPQELEIQHNAEVSTPFKLRQEMLDKIPVDLNIQDWF